MSAPAPQALRAEVSPDLCVGVGICAQLAPGAFRLNRSAQSVFSPQGDWTENDLREAADGCPMNAIRIVDGTTPVP